MDPRQASWLLNLRPERGEGERAGEGIQARADCFGCCHRCLLVSLSPPPQRGNGCPAEATCRAALRFS